MKKYLIGSITLLSLIAVQSLFARHTHVIIEENPVVYVAPRHEVIVAEAPAVYVAAAPEVYVQEAPPAELVEVVPGSPGEGYEWIKGSWRWDGRWVWHKGYWGSRPHPGAYWKPGYWHSSHGRWTWREGHWH